MECITYKKGFKYQMVEEYSMKIPIRPNQNIDSHFIDLTSEGRLTIKKDYAWDGPSGPAIDTKNFMRGSLVHDALYQLMREKHLDNEVHRKPADELLRAICQEDGMTSLRAWWVYLAVRWFGHIPADPARKVKPIKAPEGCP